VLPTFLEGCAILIAVPYLVKGQKTTDDSRFDLVDHANIGPF